jgi:hypothetical protein
VTFDATPASAAFDNARRVCRALLSRDPPLAACERSGLHNPWRYGARQHEAWPLLELCEDANVVATLRDVIGPDIVLWDSELYATAREYRAFAAGGYEGRYWPATPLEGAVALFAMTDEAKASVARLSDCADAAAAIDPGAALFVARYMPATSLFDRDPRSPANQRCMEERLLFNYANRPLWLVAGQDRAGSDFVRGFAPPVPRQTGRTVDPLIPQRRA